MIWMRIMLLGMNDVPGAIVSTALVYVVLDEEAGRRSSDVY